MTPGVHVLRVTRGTGCLGKYVHRPQGRQAGHEVSSVVVQGKNDTHAGTFARIHTLALTRARPHIHTYIQARYLWHLTHAHTHTHTHTHTHMWWPSRFTSDVSEVSLLSLVFSISKPAKPGVTGGQGFGYSSHTTEVGMWYIAPDSDN